MIKNCISRPRTYNILNKNKVFTKFYIRSKRLELAKMFEEPNPYPHSLVVLDLIIGLVFVPLDSSLVTVRNIKG